MVKIDKDEYTFVKTMKPDDLEEGATIHTYIEEIKTVPTKYGEKRLAILENETSMFLNAISLKNLVDGFGAETDDWKLKEVTISTETSARTQEKKSLVIQPRISK